MKAYINGEEKIIHITEDRDYSHWHNVIVEIKEYQWLNNNKIWIKGLQQDWRHSWNNSYDDKKPPKIEVEEEYIEEIKPWFFKPYTRVKDGWVLLKKRIPFDKEFTNYRVVEHKENEK